MALRILIIDDDEESVAPLMAELEESLPGSNTRLANFDEAESQIDSHNPQIVVLDLLRQEGSETTPDGFEVRKYVWDKKFCPLVIYTAAPESLGDSDTPPHPFFHVIKKGSASEKAVLEKIRTFQPNIEALDAVAKELYWAMNGVLRQIAPTIFERIGSEPERQDALIRSARRRVAAKMDEALSTGDPGLRTWEFYLCPPVVEQHLLIGDIIRKRDGSKIDPASYRVILTPSCDLARSDTRPSKVTRALVAKCTGVGRLLKELKLPETGTWKPEHKNALIGTLNQGHSRTCLPLPALPGEFPSMIADLRNLELIELEAIGADKEWTRIASVDNPMRELTAWAYMSLAGRPGLPDRDYGAWVDEVIAARPTT